MGMAIALLVMIAAIAFSNRDFYGADNIENTARQIAMLGIFAIGIAFVIATGGIDLSVGSVIGLTGVIIARISGPIKEGGVSGLGYSIWTGIAVAMTVALLIGLIQGLLITRLGLAPFIVTLSGMLLIRGTAQTITAGGNISFGNSEFRALGDESWEIGEWINAHVPGIGSWFTWLKVPYPVLIFLAVAAVATYVLHFSVFGRHIFALGGNREAAKYSGVPVKRVETSAYVISATLAGLAGIPYAAYIGQMTHTVGGAYELHAIAAAVLGGVSLRGGEGTILGVFIGSAMMKIMENGINMFKIAYKDKSGQPAEWRLDENWHDIVIGAVILGAIVLDQVTHILQDRKKLKK